jgi:hypothetical protein
LFEEVGHGEATAPELGRHPQGLAHSDTYQRFETTVALLLTMVISAVILVALYRLVVSVIDTLVLRTLNPLDHTVFQ